MATTFPPEKLALRVFLTSMAFLAAVAAALAIATQV